MVRFQIPTVITFSKGKLFVVWHTNCELILLYLKLDLMKVRLTRGSWVTRPFVLVIQSIASLSPAKQQLTWQAQ